MVSGQIDLPVIPNVGDLMTFEPRGSESDVALDHLRVTNRLISAKGDVPVSLSLDDITVENDDEGRKVIRFLEEAYGLNGDVWDDN